MQEKSRKATLRMVQCAVFLAMSLVIRIVEQSFPITMGGVNFMKLGLSAPFTLVPAILFGPTYGLIMGGLSDLMNLVIPDPLPWIPWLTLTAAMRGWLVGLAWKWIKGLDPSKVRKWVIGIFSTIGLIGLVNFVVSKVLPNTAYSQIIIQLNTREKTIPHVITYGFIMTSIVVFALVWVSAKMEKGLIFYSKERSASNVFLLLIAVILPSLLQTTLNTFILRELIAQHANIAFMIYYIPRIAKTLIIGVLTVIIMNDVLLLLYSKMHPEMYRESMVYRVSKE